MVRGLSTTPSSSPVLASSSSKRNTPTGSSTTSSNVENSSPGGTQHGSHHHRHQFHPSNNSSKYIVANKLSLSQSKPQSFRMNPESTATMTASPGTAARLLTESKPLHDSSLHSTPTPSPQQLASARTTRNQSSTGTTTGNRNTTDNSSNSSAAAIASSSKRHQRTTCDDTQGPVAVPVQANTTNPSNNKRITKMLEMGGVQSTRSLNSANKQVITGTAAASVATPSNSKGLQLVANSTTATTTTASNAVTINNRPLLSRTQLQQQQQSLPNLMSPTVVLGMHSPSQHQPLRERHDSHSVTSQISGPADAWQWHENNDPDDQEQALFEQRLCEDIYGVAVRKINQNGKSSLRYVKCCTIDASELEEYYNRGHGSTQFHHSSSNRSLSSRSWASRKSFSRFLSGGVVPVTGTNSSNNSHADPPDFDAHRNLITGKTVRVLTWGKKKDVKIPLDRFVAVRKGKTTERTKRNTCPASRVLSLITADDSGSSPANGTTTTLDIETPTRLDRDKFARAFSRFLNIPLLEAEQHLPTVDMRSVRSDTSPTSLHKDLRLQPSSQANGYVHDSIANISVPEIAMTNSYTTNGSSRKHAPMPVVTTSGTGPDHGGTGGLPPSKASSRNFISRKSGGNLSDRNIYSNNSLSRSNPDSFDKSDHQGSSMHSSSLQNNQTTSTGNDGHSSYVNLRHVTPQTQTHSPTKDATLEIPLSTSKPVNTSASKTAKMDNPAADDDASLVSSITGAGFDQDLVEELHLALEKMKTELEESRAEAARAVKVAEQAIQSAENSNSKDWNSTVTHKAAEAAAAAQKKSAEALARARVAEERLENEKKNALLWKKRLEDIEEQAGHWQTRAAAAEVQRYEIAESLESERKKNLQLSYAMTSSRSITSKEHKSSQEPAFDPFGNGFDVDVSCSNEIDRLRSKLAMESSRRRKLLDELQDLRGSVRVYCRPQRPKSDSQHTKPTITVASSEVLMLDRSVSAESSSSSPLSFQFDGILPPDANQHEVYEEFEAICVSVIEGYKICMMTYGQMHAGKTYTMLGKVEHRKDGSVSISDHGVHLRAMNQLFSVLEQRRDRYHDLVTMTLIEVRDERIVDLLAGTSYGEAHGRVEGSKRSASRKTDNRSDEGSSFHANSSNKPKLEIVTNRDGETVVCGVLSVELSSFEDIYQVWTQSLAGRLKRLVEQGLDPSEYELGSHVIASLKIGSRNLSTGVITSGKIQFVDFASSDITSKRGSDDSWKFANKSLKAVREVVRARSQYQRDVPYRNSTVTHILSDSLEADTKVVLISCVSPEEKDIRNTTSTLRFAQDMRKVVVGKATRHISTPSS